MIDTAEYTLLVLNLMLGLVGAWVVAGRIANVAQKPQQQSRYFRMLVGLYLAECVSVVVAMGTPILSVMLAFVWGVVLGRKMRRHVASSRIVRTSFLVALYSSSPVASFLIVPILLGLAGWSLTSTADGLRLGIPAMLPWPTNTIIGFYTACAIGAALLKTMITTWMVFRTVAIIVW